MSNKCDMQSDSAVDAFSHISRSARWNMPTMNESSDDSGWQSWATYMQLSVLPLHWQHLLLSALIWQCVYETSRKLSPYFSAYRALCEKKKVDWHIRVVSFSFSIAISVGALFLLADNTLINNPLFGYTYAAGWVYATACGYFLWDLIICFKHYEQQGPQFVLHAAACLFVFLFSFGPFAMYYGAVFLLFELSTPMLNIHWFLDKCGMAGSALQMMNGVLLMAIFFAVRIVLGLFMSYNFWMTCLQHKAHVSTFHWILYGTANVALNTLNIFWFSKMILAFRRRSKVAKETQ